MNRCILLMLSFVMMRADQVDFFAQGLMNVVKHGTFVQELRKRIQKACEDKKFEEAQQLIQEAPQEVFVPWKHPHSVEGMQSLLERCLDFGNYLDFNENNKKNYDEVMLLLIERSDKEDLLIKVPYYDILESLIKVAIRWHHSFAVIKSLMEKQPKLIDPALFDEDRDNESNDFFLLLEDHYFGMFDSIHVTNDQQIINFAAYFTQIVDKSRIYYFENEEQFFRRRQISFFRDFIQLWDVEKKYTKAALYGGKIIFSSLIERSPRSLYENIAGMLNIFLRHIDNKERYNATEPLLRYAISKFYGLSKSKEHTIKIAPSYFELIEKGLKEGESYTLKEILEKAGLENLLLKGLK